MQIFDSRRLHHSAGEQIADSSTTQTIQALATNTGCEGLSLDGQPSQSTDSIHLPNTSEHLPNANSMHIAIEDEQLKRIVESWADLPQNVRQSITLLVEASSKGGAR